MLYSQTVCVCVYLYVLCTCCCCFCCCKQCVQFKSTFDFQSLTKMFKILLWWVCGCYTSAKHYNFGHKALLRISCNSTAPFLSVLQNLFTSSVQQANQKPLLTFKRWIWTERLIWQLLLFFSFLLFSFLALSTQRRRRFVAKRWVSFNIVGTFYTKHSYKNTLIIGSISHFSWVIVHNIDHCRLEFITANVGIYRKLTSSKANFNVLFFFSWSVMYLWIHAFQSLHLFFLRKKKRKSEILLFINNN